MATISSHVLDSVIGTHASGIRVECYLRTADGQSTPVFDVVASDEGRISETVIVDESSARSGEQYELIFHSADYYKNMHLPDDGYQVMQTVVVRISMPDPDEKYHLPIMLSPHSYSVWWSGKPPAANA